MKISRFIPLFLSAAVLLTVSCRDHSGDDGPKYPYLVVTSADGSVIAADAPALSVKLNGKTAVYSEMGYERGNGNTPHYDWQIDDGEWRQYTALDGLIITRVGVHNNIALQNAMFNISFAGNDISPGSEVKLRIRDETALSRTVTFLVE